jgi:sialate O-acetylesterase
MRTRLLLLIASLLFVAGSAKAEVHLPCLFTDHMVLQESGAVPVWGTANPGEHVTVTMAGQSAEISDGVDGD